MEITSRPPLAAVIAAAADEKGVSISELSSATGIPHVTLRRRLTTGRGLRFDELEAIAAALGTTVSSLIREAELRQGGELK